MFSSVLIANRGEIAVRIIQACRELGIEAIAVYSEADRGALHVRLADRAIPLGAAPARESYLNGERVIGAARAAGARAIHPGYGFLSENPEFARATRAAGLAWIGPPGDVIALLGDKVAAKRIAQQEGVPVVPGFADSDASFDQMLAEARRIGYPIMLKAAAGGGGKGMRVVASEDQLQPALEAAGREAEAAFGDGRVFLEKLLVRPRHVEMQILADSGGQVVYLGERDCSLQRRHQKVIEEAPGPAVSPEVRAAMGQAAVRMARASGYANAGTVEFLLDGDDFYFLEVNARIQVEHPVTELVTGLDLVRLQIELAAGRPLPFTQEEIDTRGHAVEVRIYAEDPNRHFLPTGGRVTAFVPPTGVGIRNDVGVEAGDDIPTHYDPMIAKLIVSAESRAQAVSRLQYALDRYVCTGVTNNLSFLRRLAGDPAFVAGEVDIDFIDRTWHPETPEGVPRPLLVAVALADSMPANPTPDPWSVTAGWRAAGAVRHLDYTHAGQTYQVDVLQARDGAWRITALGETEDVWLAVATPDRLTYRTGDKQVEVALTRTGEGYAARFGASGYVLGRPNRSPDGSARPAGHEGDTSQPVAPMPGTVVSISVIEGQAVIAGQPLVILEAMKMEHIVEAGVGGIVRSIHVAPGDLVTAGTVLVSVERS